MTVTIDPGRMQALAPLTELLTMARRDRVQVDPPDPALIPRSEEEAYAVHRAAMRAAGLEPLGWKIAATTAEMREGLGVSGPIYGRTFRRDMHRAPAALAMSALLNPMIECETFVTLARDLPFREAPWTMAEVLDAIGEVHAGIEVAELRFPPRAMPPVPAFLADGSAAGSYVFGPRMTGWRDGLSDLTVRLEIDGAHVRDGDAAEVMGDPLRPVLWLAEEMRRWGEGLAAGEVISTGSMTGYIFAKPGQTARAIYSDGSAVEVSFL